MMRVKMIQVFLLVASVLVFSQAVQADDTQTNFEFTCEIPKGFKAGEECWTDYFCESLGGGDYSVFGVIGITTKRLERQRVVMKYHVQKGSEVIEHTTDGWPYSHTHPKRSGQYATAGRLYLDQHECGKIGLTFDKGVLVRRAYGSITVIREANFLSPAF